MKFVHGEGGYDHVLQPLRGAPNLQLRHSKDLEVLSNEVVADVEELELLGEHVDWHSGRPAKSSAALVEVEDRVETRTIAVEEVLVALAVVEAGKPRNQTTTKMIARLAKVIREQATSIATSRDGG